MISPHTNPDEFLKDLNLGDLSPEEKEKTLSMLEERFDNVILNVVLSRLSSEEFEAFKAALHSEDREVKIAEITARIPGLARDIEERILEEYRLIRAVMA
jgi:hypothetical protein